MLRPVVGIVAEYNPLHKGHLRHIKLASEISEAEAVVVVLSSDFVQRGEPALLDKWARTEAALKCGANLVLELPAIFSAHNAGVFANAAVDILAATKKVTHISFGAETPERLVDNIINILLKEPEPFKISLKKHLDLGFSYVEARARAAEELSPGAQEIFTGSNNTLALSYMMRVKKKNYDLRIVPIKRIGAAYNSAELEEYASAAAIRAALAEGKKSEALSQMPEQSRKILERELGCGRGCLSYDKFWLLLRALLLRLSPCELRRIAEMNEGIEYKIREAARNSASFCEWCGACTSKRYPAGRIRRSAVHILLGLNHWTNRAAQRLGPPYIRLLGSDETGRMLLREMRKESALPIVTTYGKAARISSYAKTVAQYELLACELWEELIPNGKFGEEHKRRAIMI